MTAPVLAWGNQNLYALPNDRGYVLGREFEVLPAGTMLAAGVLLHGVIGVEAEPAEKGMAFVYEGTPLLIIGSRGTETRELEGYKSEIIDGYREKQTSAQG